MSKEFKRQESGRHSRLGMKRKKLQKWRKPKGRDSKMRLNIKNHPKTVSIGYKSPKNKDPTPTLVQNVKQLNNLDKSSTIILAKVGAKKKLELIRAAEEKKIKILNLGRIKDETRK